MHIPINEEDKSHLTRHNSERLLERLLIITELSLYKAVFPLTKYSLSALYECERKEMSVVDFSQLLYYSENICCRLIAELTVLNCR